MIALIDNGHGRETPGKRSPDGRLREWLWTRETADILIAMLREKGIEARRIVPEERDVSIKGRCLRVNRVCAEAGKDNVLLVSLHLNAAGSGLDWREATGFTPWVAKSASDRSKRLARLLYGEAVRIGLRGNRWMPKDRYFTANFGILRGTLCPAVLTENLFMDNRDEAAFLTTAKGKETIAALHAEAIQAYVNETKGNRP